MIISGANNLRNNKQIVDELNVFPVPDGDTGTNMSLTMTAVAAEAEAKNPFSISKAADSMSFAALRGARGNSGVILSQFFRGISKSLKGKNECNAIEFANALMEGSNAAYKAVMRPTEGTILTVAREAANGALISAANDTDVVKVLSSAVDRGSRALSRTPEMLPALKQAGVVDAGGQGWIFVLEGALSYLNTNEIISTDTKKAETESKTEATPQESVSTENIKFRYCTEFLIEKNEKNSSVDSFRSSISSKGDCMLVIDDEDIVKVHIHTNHPGFVLEEAIKIGELINLKIDNMKHQHKTLIEEAAEISDNAEKTADASDTDTIQAAADNADVEDSSAATKTTTETTAEKESAPKENLKKKNVEPKEYGFVAVCAGRGFSKLLKDLGIDKTIEGGQTMNPSTEEIVKAVKRVKAKTVYVFPNNKNIIMAANLAADLLDDIKVEVIPTTSIPQCINAILSFNNKRSVSYNTKAMTKAISEIKDGQITYAVRDTVIDGVEIHKNDIIGISDGEIMVAGSDLDDVLSEMINIMVDDDSEYITVYCGKDVKKNQYDAAAKRLEAKYADDEIEVSFKKGGQPVYYYIISVE